MRKKRKLFGILLVITALIIMQLPKSEADAASSASDFQMEGTTLVKYRGTEKNVSIPKTVEVIADSAFEENDTVEKITIPDSVTEVEAYAFWGCDHLNTVVLGKGLSEVGDFVFANCKGLERITIPANIKTIGIQAFVDCVNLTDITIPPEVTNIHETAFDGCYRLVIHCEPGSIADKYAKTFYEKQQEMPEYEDVADYQPQETPDDTTENEVVTETPGNVLGETMVVANQAVFFIDNTSPVVQGGGAAGQENRPEDGQSTMLPNAEGGGTGFPKYTIVDGSAVADQAYYRRKDLGNVVLPSGIREIGQFSYARSSLTGITVPEGVEMIGYGAFYHCDSLNDIQLPETLTCVEPKAFTHTAWVDGFLAGNETEGAQDFLISGGTLIAYRGNGPQVDIPEGVRLIAAEVFKGNTGIESVSFPDTLQIIGEGAFEGCENLKTIEWSAADSSNGHVTDIKDRAFAGCPIEKAELPASLERMGLQAFPASTEIVYGGEEPGMIHEISAERLSNEGYRAPDGTEAAGVIVQGSEQAGAWLEGANRQYTLTITEASEREALERAFSRNGQQSMPEGIVLYKLTLTDSSGVPIRKLGRQLLTVTIPTPESFSGEKVLAVTLDRNGQLEQIETERVKVDGTDCIRFQTDYVSLYGIYGEGTALKEDEILEETTVLSSMGAAPGQGGQTEKSLSGNIRYQWILGGALLAAGVFLCVYRRREA